MKDPEMVKKLRKQLVIPLRALNISKWVLIGVGAALAILGLILAFKTK